MLLKSAAAIRRQLFMIEGGRCQKCKLDTENLLRKIKSLPGTAGGRAERKRIIVKASAEWGRNQETLKAAERLARHPVAGACTTHPCIGFVLTRCVVTSTQRVFWLKCHLDRYQPCGQV